jgi:dipeptidyl aminopeptidase/acylaminoacyl peptidase
MLRAAVERGVPPIFVIHGMDDDRVPVSDATRATSYLRSRGAEVEEWLVDHEDHFLFFDRDQEVLSRIAAWVKRVAP